MRRGLCQSMPAAICEAPSITSRWARHPTYLASASARSGTSRPVEQRQPHGTDRWRPRTTTTNTVSAATAAPVIELAPTTYRGFNQHYLTEMLAEHEGRDLSRSSVRRIL